MGKVKYSLHLLALVPKGRRPRSLLYHFVSILIVLAMNLLVPQICSFWYSQPPFSSGCAMVES